jgi:D-3-phosphoglycerate dehydrogenase
MVDEDLKAVEIAFIGHVSQLNVRPLAAAALAGVLRPALAEVNMVSAPSVATARGITVTESRQELSPVYDSLIRITVSTGAHTHAVAGTVVGVAPRIVEVEDMELDAPFAPSMLYVNNLDRPGFIGALGGLLGEAAVNIATFNLGRTRVGGEAIALVGVDQPVADALMAKVQALPNVKEVRPLAF